MKKLSLIAFSVLALAGFSRAQGFEGMGYDTQVNEVVGRLGVGGYNHVEVGVGFMFRDNDALPSDLKTSMTLSGRYLLALHQWDKFTGYLHLGAYFRDDNNNLGAPNFGTGSQAASLAFLAAYQPELKIFDHLAVSTTFGLAVAVMPDMQIALAGEPVSIISGLNFRVLL